MAETNVNAAASAQVATEQKKTRRGISNQTVGTTRLKFSHTDARPNGLFIGHLDDVQITTVDIKEDSAGMPSFRGVALTRLVFTFASNEEDVSKRKYQTLSFMPVESNVNTIPGGKEEWKITRIFNYLKHFLDVYVLRGQAMTDEMIDALSLGYDDTDDNGDYVNVNPQIVADSWKSLFENFVHIFNTAKDGAPAWKTKDGKNIPVWMKLIRYVKAGKNGWTPIANGQLSFPTYTGEGVIEIFVQNVVPSIKIDVVREAIKPMDVEKKKPNLAAPNAMGGVDTTMMGGPVMGSEMGLGGLGMTDGLEDMPDNIF